MFSAAKSQDPDEMTIELAAPREREQ